MTRDYYALLGITPGANQAAVHDAFFRLAYKYHADAGPGAPDLPLLNEINEAWQVLSDPVQRLQYDAARHTKSHGHHNLSLGGRAIELPALLARTPARLFGACLRLDIGSERTALVLAALEVGILLTACLGFLDKLRPFIWVAGIVLAACLAFFNFIHTTHSSRSILYSLAGILVAGVVISAIDLLVFARISSAIVTSSTYSAHVAMSANDNLLPVLPAAVEAAGCAQPCLQPAATQPVASVVADCEQSCEQPTPHPATPAPTATWIPSPVIGSSRGAPVQRSPSPVLPSSTPTPSAGFKYAAPILISPANGTSYFCHRGLTLQWRLDAAPPAGLGPDEWFLAESKQIDHPDWFGISDWTKDSLLVLQPTKGANGCDIFWWPNLGVFQWRIRVVSGDREQHAIKQFLSGAGEAFTITYGH